MSVYHTSILYFYSEILCRLCSLCNLHTLHMCFVSQLVNQNWAGEMREGYGLEKDYPGVYLGERQALNEDFTHSGFDRGHLNPNGHHAGLY